ncbi:PREDICTED: zinc metalloproteinase nas-13-like [Acropora digitifera]|uniref:zinc metalloproteinase nas-13-like n=1 Tax=Acropora digitifera TaxID=70779 RepID=UPI00077A2855|nr:PREDICTED: zinc metalloproteinase nas-13-like [Acropora digitifera]
MLVLFAIFWPLVISETYGSPISDPFYDDPQASATDVINKINEVEDIDGNFFEGDILVDPNDPIHGGILRKKRNARRLRSFVWQSKIIPYEISTQLVGDGYETTILSAIEEFSKHTCIKWKPHVNEPRWVKFVKDRGCFSSVGVNFWKTGSQVISLGNGCNHKGVTMHEMMHAAGFWHEQSRYDRDKYVEILWENIQANRDHNFKKYDLREIDYLDEVYDTDSIMHYGKTSFSKNGKPTILALGDPSKPLGQRDGFSQTDIAQLNALYDCAGSSSGWSSWTAFGPCDARCMHVRQRFCASTDLANCPGAHPYYHTQRDEQKCPDSKCSAPVNGHWGRWSAWSSCSVTCNKGNTAEPGNAMNHLPRMEGKIVQGITWMWVIVRKSVADLVHMIVSLKRVECVAGRFAISQTTHQPGSVIQEQQQALVPGQRKTIRLAQVIMYTLRLQVLRNQDKQRVSPAHSLQRVRVDVLSSGIICLAVE